jgi:hypothetical protein
VSNTLGGLVRAPGLADPDFRSGRTRAVGRVPLQSGMPCFDLLPPGFGRRRRSPGGSERDVSDPTRRPASQAARLPTIPTSGRRDDEVPGASAVDDAAVAAYRLSVQAGNPLSERRLAGMFGRTSRRWARARIADARRASAIQDSPSAPVMA